MTLEAEIYKTINHFEKYNKKSINFNIQVVLDHKTWSFLCKQFYNIEYLHLHACFIF